MKNFKLTEKALKLLAELKSQDCALFIKLLHDYHIEGRKKKQLIDPYKRTTFAVLWKEITLIRPEPTKTIEERKAIFITDTKNVAEGYSSELIKRFIDHWTQHGPRDKKMKFEKTKGNSFGHRARLATFKRLDKKFNESNEEPQKARVMRSTKIEY